MNNDNETDNNTMYARRHADGRHSSHRGTDETLGRLPGTVFTEGGGGDEPPQHTLAAVVGWGSLSAGDAT